jgi:hypothetical protein
MSIVRPIIIQAWPGLFKLDRVRIRLLFFFNQSIGKQMKVLTPFKANTREH